MKNQLYLNITPKSIVLILSTLLAIYLIGSVLGLIVLFILAYILASALRPIAKWLQKTGLPFSVGAIMVFLAFLMVFILTVGSLIPIVVEQARSIYDNRTEIAQSLEFAVQTLPSPIAEDVSNYIQTLPTIIGDYIISPRLLGNVLGILAGVGGLFLFFIVTVYILIDQSSPANLIKKYWPRETKEMALDSFKAFDLKISQWVRGQIILSLSVGLLSYVGLKILGVPYSELLALTAAIVGLIPYIGPWIGGILAVIVALTVSPLLALYVAILYFAIQQLESAVLVPRVMKRAVGLSPVAIIFIVTVGLALFGVWGALIAIPLAAGSKAAIDAYIRRVNG